jgi:hypothetical protein
MSESEAPVAASAVEPEASPPNVETEPERYDFNGKQLTADELWDEVVSNEVYYLPVDALKPARINPRRGHVASVIESLKEFGQHRPVVVQRSTREVIVGNHLLRAVKSLGWHLIQAIVVDDDDDKALRRAVADNATGDKAQWDEVELAEVLQKVGAVPGYEDDELSKLLAKLEPPKKPEQPTYPLVPRLNEKYDYVVVFCENETDWMWLQTKFDLRREKSYKSEAVATSHVITVERLQELLGEG